MPYGARTDLVTISLVIQAPNMANLAKEQPNKFNDIDLVQALHISNLHAPDPTENVIDAE